MAKLAPIQETLDEPRANPSHPDIRVCAVCGQSYDMAKLADAHHHVPEPHEQRPAPCETRAPREEPSPRSSSKKKSRQ